MTLDEQAIYRDYQKAYQRRELERNTLQLEARYHFDDDQEYWRKVFGEVELPELTPESDEPFSTMQEKCFDEPETQAQQVQLERFGYYYKNKL